MASTQQDGAVRRQKKAPIKFLVPLVYAPVLPLIRIGLRKNPVLRDRLFTAVLAGAFIHGSYLVYATEFLEDYGDSMIVERLRSDLYDIESK